MLVSDEEIIALEISDLSYATTSSDTDRQWLWRFSEATMSDLFEVNLGLSIVPKNLSS